MGTRPRRFIQLPVLVTPPLKINDSTVSQKKAVWTYLGDAIPTLVAATAAGATTIQDFDGGGTAFTLTQHWSPPTATVVAGGPDGNFLRLANAGVNNQLIGSGRERHSERRELRRFATSLPRTDRY